MNGNVVRVARQKVVHIFQCHDVIQRRSIWTRTPEGLDKIPPEQVLIKDDRSYRARQHGHKPLPLPPLLDEIVINAQSKHRTPKPRQKKQELTEFQKQLENNPHAHALASTIRRCNVTQARLPSHFLIPLKSELIPGADLTDKEKPLARFTPDISESIDQSEKAKQLPQTTYVLNSVALLKALKRKWLLGLVPDQTLNRIAGMISRSPNAIKVTKIWEFDEDFPKTVEQALLNKLMRQIRTARQGWKSESERLLLPLTEAESCLADIAAFIKFDKQLGAVRKLHGRDCFEIEETNEQFAGEIYGLKNDRRTLNLRIMLEKFFAYKASLDQV